MHYEFTLIYSVNFNGLDEDEVTERLFEHGCDDALIGMGRSGILSIDFAREAQTAEQAMCSASSDVGDAFPQAQLLEAKPDMVSITEISGYLGITRQAVAQHISSTETFPNPLYFGSPSLWHLDAVLSWYKENSKHIVPDWLLEIAVTARGLNGDSRNAFAPLIPLKRRSPGAIEQANIYTSQLFDMIVSIDYSSAGLPAKEELILERQSPDDGRSEGSGSFAGKVIRSNKEEKVISTGWTSH